MSAFEMVHQDAVVGKLVGFDRLIFKGHLTRFYPKGGMKAFLDRHGVLLKDFGTWAKRLSDQVKAHAQGAAAQAGRPYLYLAETHTKAKGNGKEDLARSIMARDGVVAGLICVLAAVEPCSSFDIFRNKQTKRREIIRRRRKCLHYYWYFVHPELGFCHVRVQGWLPFEVQIWVNGREALSTSLAAKGVRHTRYLNAIVSVASWSLAQRLAERWASRRWSRLLDGLARQVNPHLAMLRKAGYGPYWWVVDQAEVATDVAFRSRRDLEAVLPTLFAHAASAFSAEDVLRFLGRKLTPQLACEVTSSARRRPEGWRVKHTMARNSIKCYDKANVLRVETTINDPTQFRVLRNKNGHRVWCPMRKGVANLARYYQVGRGANERYLEALAAAHYNTDAIRVLDRHCRPIRNRGRQHPRLNPIGHDDLALFRAALAGEHLINGFRNAHLQARLYPRPARDDVEVKRRCARTSRLIVKLRGHGLVAKVPRRRLYRVTPYGQRFMSAALAVHDQHFPAAFQQAAA
ncbi:hypothetical protein K6U06_05585 [Acidiferrimicrobium sp. IK]|uniref:hypothetical protein n=1 Tax=Acidiferrimicrobium sp. IK TaxID=2871700 RepID=UPI0021CB28E6|nr:hypothetical protein [Acidiferrimicrobium sp. IK]MCU4183824.1 hypothetical protein [Acidiferrimicrobium sp. IK]